MQTPEGSMQLESAPPTRRRRAGLLRATDTDGGFMGTLRRATRSTGKAVTPLFPLPPRSAVPTPWVIAGYALAWPVLVLIFLFRQSGLGATHTMWAEDGSVFYQETLTHSIPWTLTSPYNGYVQLVPRLVVGATRLFAVRDAPAVISVLGAVCVAGVVLLVFHASRGLIPSVLGRLALAATMTLLPLATIELLDNAVNVPWWLFIGCFWALLWRPKSVAGALVAGATCMLCAASDPATAIFIPLVAARVVALPRIREHGGSVGLLAGLCFQGVAVARGGSSALGQHSAYDLLQLLAVRAWLGSVTGVQPTNWLLVHHWSMSVVLGVVVVIAVAALVMVQPSRGVKLMAIFAVGLGAVLFVIQVWLRGFAPAMAHQPLVNASRYGAVPILLLLAVVIAAASQLGGYRWAGTAATVLCCIALAPAWALGFRLANDRSTGPDWDQQVLTATRLCAHPGTLTTTVHTDPSGWVIDVPCTALVTPRPKN